jgi:hypothetical protein
MPVVLMLFFFLGLNLLLLIGSAHGEFTPIALFIIATIIATAGLLRAARMLDKE